jgi:hypothetical protein
VLDVDAHAHGAEFERVDLEDVFEGGVGQVGELGPGD